MAEPFEAAAAGDGHADVDFAFSCSSPDFGAELVVVAAAAFCQVIFVASADSRMWQDTFPGMQCH